MSSTSLNRFRKVPNHTSDQHDWFLLSRNNTPGYEDYYVWRNCPLTNPNGPQDGPRNLPNNWVRKTSENIYNLRVFADKSY